MCNGYLSYKPAGLFISKFCIVKRFIEVGNERKRTLGRITEAKTFRYLEDSDSIKIKYHKAMSQNILDAKEHFRNL